MGGLPGKRCSWGSGPEVAERQRGFRRQVQSGSSPPSTGRTALGRGLVGAGWPHSLSDSCTLQEANHWCRSMAERISVTQREKLN